MFTYYFLIVIIFQQLDLKWNSQNRLITSTSFIISSVFMYKLQYLGLRKIAVKKFYLTICWLIKTEQEIHQGTLSTTTETSLKKIVNVKNKFLWSLWPRNKVSDKVLTMATTSPGFTEMFTCCSTGTCSKYMTNSYCHSII